MADIQRAIARRRKRVTHGLPEWGKDLPDDVRAIYYYHVTCNSYCEMVFSFLNGWRCLGKRASGNRRS